MDDNLKRELAEVYEKAAEYLEEKGWCPALGPMGGPGCIDQALWAVNPKISRDAISFAVTALELEGSLYDTGHDASTLGRWNDDPSRTEDEVINTLHALANKLR